MRRVSKSKKSPPILKKWRFFLYELIPRTFSNGLDARRTRDARFTRANNAPKSSASTPEWILPTHRMSGMIFTHYRSFRAQNMNTIAIELRYIDIFPLCSFNLFVVVLTVTRIVYEEKIDFRLEYRLRLIYRVLLFK